MAYPSGGVGASSRLGGAQGFLRVAFSRVCVDRGCLGVTHNLVLYILCVFFQRDVVFYCYL